MQRSSRVIDLEVVPQAGTRHLPGPGSTRIGDVGRGRGHDELCCIRSRAKDMTSCDTVERVAPQRRIGKDYNELGLRAPRCIALCHEYQGFYNIVSPGTCSGHSLLAENGFPHVLEAQHLIWIIRRDCSMRRKEAVIIDGIETAMRVLKTRN